MKKLNLFTFSILIATITALTSTLTPVVAVASEEPVQHLELADVTSYEEAKQVFTETTAKMQSKTKLNANELGEIHIITYSLEKAVAYFAENMEGEQKARAKIMANVVELVHLGSENNRPIETKVYLDEYFKLADTFAAGL